MVCSLNDARRRRRPTMMLGGLILLTVSALTMFAEPVLAGNRDMRNAIARYPDIDGTVLDSCTLCHVSDRDFSLDPYGRDYDRNQSNFAAIESFDSDGDGFTNLAEIQALTFPGKADSVPTGETPTPTMTIEPTATETQAPTPTATAEHTATEAPPATPTETQGAVFLLFLPWSHGGAN